MKKKAGGDTKKKKKFESGSHSLASTNKDDRKIVTSLYVLSPADLALMVTTAEPGVVFQVLEVLYELIGKKPDEVGLELIGRGLLEDVLSLQPHPIYISSRYRFLSKMYLLFPKEGHRFQTLAKDLVHTAFQDAITTEDVALKGNALQFVALLTEDQPQDLFSPIEDFDMNKLFAFLNEPDVDVQNNSLAVLKNLLSCPLTSDKPRLVDDPNFKRLLTQVACPYPEIQQNALDVLHLLLSSDGQYTKWLQQEFFDAAGLDLIFTVLFVFHWRDLHPKCFKILWSLANTTNDILKIDSVNGLQKLVSYITFIENDELQELDLDVIIKAANFPDARLVMSGLGVFEVLTELLKTGSEQTTKKAVQALGLLSCPPADLAQLSRIDPVPTLLGILKDDECSVDLRRSAARTLAILVREVPVAALTLSNRDNFGVLESVVGHTDNTDLLAEVLDAMSTVLSNPDYCSRLYTKELTSLILAIVDGVLESVVGHTDNTDLLAEVLDAMSTVLSNPDYCSRLYTKELTSLILAIVDGGCRKLSVPALRILSLSLTREQGRCTFVADRGVTDVMKILYTSQDKEVIEAVGLLLATAFRDLPLTQAFIRAGISSWLQTRGGKWKDCPQLERALSALFGSDLSLKLEMLGHLDLRDTTKDHFYVYRSPARPSQDLQLIPSKSEEELDTDPPIYYLKMGLKSTRQPLTQVNHSFLHLADHSDKYLNGEDAEDPFLDPQSGCSLSKQSQMDLVVDNRLLEIYHQLKKDLSESNIVSGWCEGERYEGESMAEMVGLVGKAVARAMSGEKYSYQCTNHTLKLHINQLKEKFGSLRIPIGAVEVGLKLERAILFKVLADRIGLPCALVRGGYATGWVEVALPEISVESPYKRLPDRELTPNFIVDLMQKPGYLIPRETGLALEYKRSPNFSTLGATKGRNKKTSEITNESCKVRQHFHIEVDEPTNRY